MATQPHTTPDLSHMFNTDENFMFDNMMPVSRNITASSHAPMSTGHTSNVHSHQQPQPSHSISQQSGSMNTKSRRPLQNASTNSILMPPLACDNTTKLSHKNRSVDNLSVAKRLNGQPLQSMAMAPPPAKGLVTDELKKKPFLSKFKTVAQKPPHLFTDPSLAFTGKENMRPSLYQSPISTNIDVFSPTTKGNGKRALMEAAPIKDSRPNKKTKQTQDDEPVEIPAWDAFPAIVDDGQKPGHSYAQLIGMAILRSPNRRLTLAQIYKWISDTYSFYPPNDAGWQNSIRHNLSLNKAFSKMERGKDDPGKGNYWYIVEGMENQFVKEKPVRKTSSAAENIPIMSSRLEVPQSTKGPSTRPQLHTMPSHQLAQQPEATLPTLPPSQSQPAPAVDISSDATIPISDLPGQEENADRHDNDSALDSLLYSPLPTTVHSSPPVTRHYNAGNGTPPSLRTMSSSVAQSRKKLASVDDSGYISSLDSSVMRQSKILPTDSERPRHKRGRAEEEIARIRASSYESPTKNRSASNFVPPSSSPMRHNTALLHPLTPAMKFKASIKPPASVSPNTNLRMHRDKVQSMLQSPLRKMTGIFGENTPWSPAFKLEESAYLNDTMIENTNFDIFQEMANDDFFSGLPNIEQGSPIKRPVKRGRLERTQSLLDTPGPKIWEDGVPACLDTPSRAFEGLSSPTKHLMGSPLKASALNSTIPPPPKITVSGSSKTDTSNLATTTAPPSIQAPQLPWAALSYNPELRLDEPAEVSGLDMLQGFQKLGSGEALSGATANKGTSATSKPAPSRFFPMF
ncbi:Forkhead protein sep1 [Ceratocystis lukuohia]|uniref:Forkhead protein sep1 n=2 Tax=Ceratocystis TaxID=5157 RepID=A0A2C5WXH9_9PEZI|nr:Forkhead protein sep1 [Ceratocystis fimbriata CBS 114723]